MNSYHKNSSKSTDFHLYGFFWVPKNHTIRGPPVLIDGTPCMYPLLVHYHKIYFEGKSIKSQIKRITNRGEANVGREILTISEDGVEENFLTADLIQKATPVVVKNDLCFGNLCFTKEKGIINKKFLLRHHNDADDGNMGSQVSKGGTQIKLDTVTHCFYVILNDQKTSHFY